MTYGMTVTLLFGQVWTMQLIEHWVGTVHLIHVSY